MQEFLSTLGHLYDWYRESGVQKVSGTKGIKYKRYRKQKVLDTEGIGSKGIGRLGQILTKKGSKIAEPIPFGPRYLMLPIPFVPRNLMLPIPYVARADTFCSPIPYVADTFCSQNLL
jgi:hypothetical protein